MTRSSLGWFFVHAPGIDEGLLLLDRTDNFFVNKRLQAVTDGRGQLLAIADSAGFITEAYAGSGHDQSSWQGAGLTTQAQSYNPRKWQTDDTWGGIQQFRNRAYDPATGTWIQEDPMGVAGGVNVYRFNNGNPVSFGDPFGLCADSEGGGDTTKVKVNATFCSREGKLNLYDQEGNLVLSTEAGNNTVKPNGDPNVVGSNGPAPDGTFPVQAPIFNPEPAISYGPVFFPVGRANRGDIARQRGIGIHGGRNGPQSRTEGCIRISNADASKIAKDFQLMSITIGCK